MSEQDHDPRIPDGVCRCDRCRDPEEAARKRQQMMEEYGWIIDFVRPDNDYPYGVNYHTHGLPEKYGHPDLQIVMSLDPNVASGVLWDAVNQIEKGTRFQEDLAYDNILGMGYKVKFIKAQECDREVLRMILPDKEGRLDLVDMDEPYQGQYA